MLLPKRYSDFFPTTPISFCIFSFFIVTFSFFLSPSPIYAQSTDPNFKVAFIADQGSDGAKNENPKAVLDLIKAQGAQMVIHSGDLDYVNNPGKWDGLITQVLGADFPYLASVGNHDAGLWSKYQTPLSQRIQKSGITCVGNPADLGTQTHCYYKNLSILLSGFGTKGTAGNAGWISQEFAQDPHTWKICSWHKPMAAMQVGSKGDELGSYDPYEACKEAGAIIATGHEHSYSRTKTLTSFSGHTLDTTCTDGSLICVAKGKTFAFVSGLGGQSIRDQTRCIGTAQGSECPQWAATYTNSTPQRGTDYGALFLTFNVEGNPNKAQGAFITTDGVTRDTFSIMQLGSTQSPTPQNPPTSPLPQSQLKVMTYNFRYFRPHTKPIIANYLKNNQIDVVSFQELQYENGNTIAEMTSALADAGYPMNNVSTSYSPQPEENLAIFYNATKFDLVEPLQTSILSNAGISDVRKIITIKIKEKSTGQTYRIAAHHPVSGENEQSCDQNIKSMQFLDTFNDPNTILIGDFNLQVNTQETKYITRCNTLYPQKYWVSCRPGETTQHGLASCDPDGASDPNPANHGIDFVMVNKSGPLKIVDSFYESSAFPKSKSNTGGMSDHFPIVAVVSTSGTTTQQPPAQEQKKQIKVMTYNVHQDLQNAYVKQTMANSHLQMEDIANYMIANQVDIAALQEMTNWPALKKSIPDTAADLDEILKAKNYPMELYWKKMPGSELGHRVVIASRYPAISESLEAVDTTHERWAPSIQINTPLGKIRIMGVHTTYGGTYCPTQTGIIGDTIKNHFQNDPYLIAMGDWNVSACNGEFGKQFSSFDKFCTKNCGLNMGLDWIISPPGNVFKMIDGYKDPNKKMSDHIPAIAVLTLKDGQSFPSSSPNAIGQSGNPQTASGSFNVMTFNTEKDTFHPKGCDNHTVNPDPLRFLKASEEKARKIAEYIKQLHDQGKDIHVLMLQEMDQRCERYPDYDETLLLKKSLTDVGYPMDAVMLPYEKENPTYANNQSYRVSTFSVYPIHKDQMVGIPLYVKEHYTDPTGGHNGIERWAMTVPIDTPLGTIKFTNLHARFQGGQEQCDQIRDIFKISRADTSPAQIIAGDFNTLMGKDSCGLNYSADYLIHDPDPTIIDGIFLKQSSHMQFNGAVRDASGPTSDHRPIYTQIVGSLVGNPPINQNQSGNGNTSEIDIPDPTPTPEYIDTAVEIPLMGIKLGKGIPPSSTIISGILRLFTGAIWWRE